MTHDAELSPGRWLKAARERADYQVAARFAEAISVAPSVLSTYETDKVKVPDDISERIARTLRMDIIEVRRGLGLWVPPGNGEQKPFSLDDMSVDELMHYTEQRMRAERERRRDASEETG